MNRKQRRAAEAAGKRAGAFDPRVAGLFAAGLAHHQAGRLAQAETFYRETLALQDDHADALHLLGVIACEVGHPEVAVDGIGFWLILLSTFLTPICMLVSWRAVQDRVKEFFAFLLLLEFGLVGVFMAQDLFLFYVFWEVSLVPMYFLIGIWGHDRRIYAAVKFFLYTMAGSMLMLTAAQG